MHICVSTNHDYRRFGALQVYRGNLSTGLLTSFMLYTLTIAMAFAFLSSLYGNFMTAVGASVRIYELMDRIPEGVQRTDGPPLSPSNFEASVVFDNVSFTYPTRTETPVLRAISFTTHAGSVTALVGQSGGGKSTIVAMLERFYDPNSGSITIGGYDLKKLDHTWYRSQVALGG